MILHFFLFWAAYHQFHTAFSVRSENCIAPYLLFDDAFFFYTFISSRVFFIMSFLQASSLLYFCTCSLIALITCRFDILCHLDRRSHIDAQFCVLWYTEVSFFLIALTSIFVFNVPVSEPYITCSWLQNYLCFFNSCFARNR